MARLPIVDGDLSDLRKRGFKDRAISKKLKRMFDVYYVYYLAAQVSLAYGDFSLYFLLVEEGRVQLTEIEQLLEAIAGYPVGPSEGI